MWYGDGGWNKVETGREPGVQDESRQRKDRREKDDVGSAAKRAMSWYMYIWGYTVCAICATAVVDDGGFSWVGEWSTLNDVALIL